MLLGKQNCDELQAAHQKGPLSVGQGPKAGRESQHACWTHQVWHPKHRAVVGISPIAVENTESASWIEKPALKGQDSERAVKPGGLEESLKYATDPLK